MSTFAARSTQAKLGGLPCGFQSSLDGGITDEGGWACRQCSFYRRRYRTSGCVHRDAEQLSSGMNPDVLTLAPAPSTTRPPSYIYPWKHLIQTFAPTSSCHFHSSVGRGGQQKLWNLSIQFEEHVYSPTSGPSLLQTLATKGRSTHEHYRHQRGTCRTCRLSGLTQGL